MSILRTISATGFLSLSSVVVLACSDSASKSAPADDAGTPAADGGADTSVPSTCPAVTGAGTKHDATPTADETWTAAASPHVIGAKLSIPAGRTITVEPCAIVQIKSASGMIVEGKLLAVGAADKPIRIERGDAALAWQTIETRKGSEIRLAHVTIDGGGDPNGGRLTQVGALDIRGDQESATQPIVFVDHVTVKGSQSLGVLVREGGGFAPGSTDLTISGGPTFPISIWGRAAGTLPSGTYTGNAVDEVLLPALDGLDNIKEDTTFAARGVPYRVGGPTGGKIITVGANGSVPLLTIQAGVTMRFEKDARLDIDALSGAAIGALRVEGTADKPITFASAAATPAAGDWVGIVIEGTPDARDRITHAKVSHAGGASQISSFDCPGPLSAGGFADDGAILIVGGQPAGVLVTNTTIESSASDGIVRGWTGTPVDLLPTNTFTNIARCNQTFPKPQVGSCPDPAPCPGK